MAKRPTIDDLARVAGVSVATVDRVMNERHPVREETAHRVLAAAETLGYHATGLLKQRLKANAPERRLGFLLQKKSQDFYRDLGEAFIVAAQRQANMRARVIIEYIDELSPAVIARTVRGMAGRIDALALVSVDHPFVTQAIGELAAMKVPVFALLSDITAPARTGYVGVDNRKAGRTAAWMIARTARNPGDVGILVGSHRYLGQELREIGCRSYFREHAPEFRVLEPLVNLDDTRIAYEATLELLHSHPDLVGLQVAGGGTEGVIAALRDEPPRQPICVVCNELVAVTRAALIDGVVTCAIATPKTRVAEYALAAMARALEVELAVSEPIGNSGILPFELYVSENV